MNSLVKIINILCGTVVAILAIILVFAFIYGAVVIGIVFLSLYVVVEIYNNWKRKRAATQRRLERLKHLCNK